MAGLPRKLYDAFGLALLSLLVFSTAVEARAVQHPPRQHAIASQGRDRTSLNQGWRFARFNSSPDSLSYDILKPWILPTANDFIVDGDKHEVPTEAPPGDDVEFVQSSFDDAAWEAVNLPHDWAIKGPFGAGGISGGMGRLPSNGVGWYRRILEVAESDAGKSILLDIDGAMMHSAVWLNGHLVGGWPYGYASYRLDLTPYVKFGEENQLAIRLDNPLEFSRWYPGAGLYRNVWLVKVNPVHVAQFGTFVTTPSVSKESADVQLAVEVENNGDSSNEFSVHSVIYSYNAATGQPGSEAVASFPPEIVTVEGGAKASVKGSATVSNPLLWGPVPEQTPNQYVVVTTLMAGNSTIIDQYPTVFGIRSIDYDANEGVLVNGQKVRIQGTNNHHDLGSLGAAFNNRAAQRQLEMLLEMGCNSLRMSHNPPASELLDMADSMGFLVMDEAFDTWNQAKADDDYHLLFPDWHEPDLRSFLRRDRNHPSIAFWSIGNEIPEQQTAEGGATGQVLQDILVSEDATRPTTSAFNSARENAPLTAVVDMISLNYQGEGQGTSWTSSFPGFHRQYPDKLLLTTESASALSTRGTYLFPVVGNQSATIGDGSGGDWETLEASAYEQYGPSWGSSPDKVFTVQDTYPYVAGEFVWTGWDYLGEPTPYGDNSSARSSYFGIIDLAGFPKDRFYLYQARWRPDLPMAHLLPHWSWPAARAGEVTPVHVFSAADEAELFVNGASAGRQTKNASTFRFRWDDVVYAPGEVRVETFKDGAPWATDARRTVGAPAGLHLAVDRAAIAGDGRDLAFVTVAVVDADGATVPYADHAVTFAVAGPGELVATDNGKPTDLVAFPSPTRDAFGGLALAIIRAVPGSTGEITVTATSEGLSEAQLVIEAS
jgi:beta-galactosidase